MLALLASQQACDAVAADIARSAVLCAAEAALEARSAAARAASAAEAAAAASAAARSAVALTSSSPVVAQPAAIATKSTSALALNAVFFILESSFVGKTAGALFNKLSQAAMKTTVFIILCRELATIGGTGLRVKSVKSPISGRAPAGEAKRRPSGHFLSLRRLSCRHLHLMEYCI